MGYRSQVHIYAFGNLEYMSSALLEDLSSSGIVVSHAPCGGNSLGCLLSEWSEDDPAPATVMLISRCYTMANSCFFQSTGSKYNFFCVYPKDRRPVTLDNVPEYKKAYVREEFVWENLLNDNMNNACEMMNDDDDPLFICEICNDLFKICGEFITHLKSEEHIEQLSEMVPRDCDSDEPRHFCRVCNYPGYNSYNMLLHNQSEGHIRKLAESSRKRAPLSDGSFQRNKMQR
ncbi:hypothetical protein Rs2_18208 [Raphanus sativus]|nr:hypothetical protein Rs2_18208 [Raphanus sativus]